MINGRSLFTVAELERVRAATQAEPWRCRYWHKGVPRIVTIHAIDREDAAAQLRSLRGHAVLVDGVDGRDTPGHDDDGPIVLDEGGGP